MYALSLPYNDARSFNIITLLLDLRRSVNFLLIVSTGLSELIVEDIALPNSIFLDGSGT